MSVYAQRVISRYSPNNCVGKHVVYRRVQRDVQQTWNVWRLYFSVFRDKGHAEFSPAAITRMNGKRGGYVGNNILVRFPNRW